LADEIENDLDSPAILRNKNKVSFNDDTNKSDFSNFLRSKSNTDEIKENDDLDVPAFLRNKIKK